MANRRMMQNRRNDYGRNDRGHGQGYGQQRGVSPWQGPPPTAGLNSLLPLGGSSTEATLALANNLITNLLQNRQQAVPSLLDMPMPIRRDFGPPDGHMDRFDRGGGYNGPNRMGNQGNFRRTGAFNRSNERMNHNRKPFRPNDGQRQHNRNAQRNDDSKAKPKESAEAKTESKDEDKDTKKGSSRYDEIPAEFLKCHICNTTMWDGRSFENHLNGKSHAIMMQKTAESYALTADMMRQEFKIREMKRNRKQGAQQLMDFYCAMCDMYASDGASHRPTIGHRKLKKYLHPSCLICQKEMPTRIELDEHKLTVEHLRRRPQTSDKKKDKTEAVYMSTLFMEQANVGHVRRRSEKDGTQAEVKREEVSDEGKVLEFKEGDDVSVITTESIPGYNPERGVGSSFVEELKCFRCNLCSRYLEADAAETHLKTRKHHQMYIKLLREKAGIKEEGTKRGRDSASGGDGDAKRRRVQDADNDGDNNMDAGVKPEEIEGDEEWDDQMPNEEQHENGGDNENGDNAEEWEKTVEEILGDEGKEDANPDITEEQPENPEEEEKQEPQPEQQDSQQEEPQQQQEETQQKEEGTPQKQQQSQHNRGSPRRGGPRGRRARGRGRF